MLFYHRRVKRAVKEKVQVKPNEELNGSMLQSPDDIDATYRKKQGRHCRGQSVNVTYLPCITETNLEK